MRTAAAIVAGVVVCLAVGSAPVAVAGPDAWYAALRKPAWTPPPAAFGIVWPILFVLMGTAAGLAGVRQPRVLWPFAAQLLLNAAWTVVFFRWHAVGWSVAEIVALHVATVTTVQRFAAVRPLAAWLMGPYLLWVTFAATLDAAIWRLNGG